MNKTTYISGPMTGLPDYNRAAFNAAAAVLRDEGFAVVSPAEIKPDADHPEWEDYLKADIKALCDCDRIVLLPGWENSKGAHFELQVAHRFGLEVKHLADMVQP